MSEQRWVVTKDMLNVLLLIRSNCQMCSNCEWCPLYFSEEYKGLTAYSCRIGGAINPEDWELSGLEVYNEAT